MNPFVGGVSRPVEFGSRPHTTVIKRTIEQFDLEQIERALAEFGSPLFFLFEDTLQAKYRSLQAALSKYYPFSSIAYSYKTNYLPRILQILKEEGAWAEVVSGFEYSLAKKLGYVGPHIVFNGPLKRENDIVDALHDRCIFNIDNHEELTKVARLAAKEGVEGAIGIRLNSRNEILKRGNSDWTRFGFNIESGEAEEVCATIARNKHLRLEGYHIHIGTDIADPGKYEYAAEVVASFALRMKTAYGMDILYIDMGGGFGVEKLQPNERSSWDVPPIGTFLQSITRPVKQKLNPAPRLIIEPGRLLVAECMGLATRIIAVRRGDKDTTEVVVDASTSMAPTISRHFHPIRAFARNPNQEERSFSTVFGSSCTPMDVLGKAFLPKLEGNDILLIECCGAYSLSSSSQFISPRPAVIAIDASGATTLVRCRETAGDLTDLDLF